VDTEDCLPIAGGKLFDLVSTQLGVKRILPKDKKFFSCFFLPCRRKAVEGAPKSRSSLAFPRHESSLVELKFLDASFLDFVHRGFKSCWFVRMGARSSMPVVKANDIFVSLLLKNLEL
jgi:hypothetical protein